MTNPQVPNSVSTSNGTYYVGMTKAQAEKQKIYSCFIGVDFKDLDTDKNGTLDQKEILQGIKKQAGRDKWQSGISSTLLCGAGLLLYPLGIFSAGTSVVAGTALATAGCLETGNYDAALKREEEAQKHLDMLQ